VLNTKDIDLQGSSPDFKEFYKLVFNRFFDGLYRYAYTIVKDNDKARDAVQTVFAKWWEGKKALESPESAKAYLYTAVYRQCLNTIRNEKTQTVHKQNYVKEISDVNEDGHEILMIQQLDQTIKAVIEGLPPQCKLAFLKSRFEEKSYHEIAEEMSLSVKTVEAHIGKALKILRENLKEYV
jgi:RNA polymerase sigma-70 factor (ECF subfamily)